MQASEVAIECCCSVRQAGGAISVDGVQPGADSGDAVQLDVSHSVLKVSPFLSLAPASREWASSPLPLVLPLLRTTVANTVAPLPCSRAPQQCSHTLH